MALLKDQDYLYFSSIFYYCTADSISFIYWSKVAAGKDVPSSFRGVVPA